MPFSSWKFPSFHPPIYAVVFLKIFLLPSTHLCFGVPEDFPPSALPFMPWSSRRFSLSIHQSMSWSSWRFPSFYRPIYAVVFLKISIFVPTHLCLGFSIDFSPSTLLFTPSTSSKFLSIASAIKNLYGCIVYPTRATCPVHLILHRLFTPVFLTEDEIWISTLRNVTLSGILSRPPLFQTFFVFVSKLIQY